MRSRSRSRSRYRRHRDRRTRSRSRARSRRRHRDRSPESSYKRRRELSRSRNRSTKRAASCSSSGSSLSDGKISKYVREEKKSRRNEQLLMANQLKLTSTVPTTVEMPAGLRTNSSNLTTTLQQVDSSNLMKATIFPLDESVIEKRAQQLLQARIADVDAEVASRLAAAKSDLEAQIRARISMELQEEISACQRREATTVSGGLFTCTHVLIVVDRIFDKAESKQRCEELERQLQAKLQELEESKRKLDEERLLMLETKRMLETERQELKKEKDKIVREEQTIILGKGGSRPKLKFSLNKTK
ncbi:Uncharacterized protein T07_8905 [Trichinella nelsoni]|uniref:Arginine and glutamate-rich protein 1 n=2 Tax=Trichinella TaxID=6333 RepID=A0A0V0SCV7_9BILA|nr:Uncharacterized protein T07_8905 [Trichinella nelsoni]KRY28099.1 Uncharacterized protein T01_3521 [Trichinella spiralis]